MASKPVDFHTHSLAEILKVYIDTFTGFSYVPGPGSPHTMFLSQGCILREVSGIREGKQNTLSKGRKGSEEPPVACVQLMDILMTSNKWDFIAKEQSESQRMENDS